MYHYKYSGTHLLVRAAVSYELRELSTGRHLAYDQASELEQFDNSVDEHDQLAEKDCSSHGAPQGNST